METVAGRQSGATALYKVSRTFLVRRFVELYPENGCLLQGKKVTYSTIARVSSISFIEEGQCRRSKKTICHKKNSLLCGSQI